MRKARVIRSWSEPGGLLPCAQLGEQSLDVSRIRGIRRELQHELGEAQGKLQAMESQQRKAPG
jgi:hypothetical protein